MAASTRRSGRPATPAWEISTLKNGLRVVTTPIPTSQAASVSVFIGVGSRAEARRVNGVSHYLEHMLFKGTDRRPEAIQIAGAIEGAGGARLDQSALSRHQVTSATRLRCPVFS